jgi:hypothetical protein
MKYVSVLTPPFLMCVVVIFAIVAFLRHEMSRGRGDSADEDVENSAGSPPPDDRDATAPRTESGATGPTRPDTERP